MTPDDTSLPGVYCILNVVTGQRYVGSTIVSFRKRWRSHRVGLRKGNHSNLYLQRAWNKYGESAFRFLVLVYCDPDNCLTYEQAYIDYYESYKFVNGYNRRPKAESNLGITFGDGMRAKISATFKGKPKSEEHKRKISEALKGRKLSPEHIEKTASKKRGIKLSSEHKAKISKACTEAQASPEYRAMMSAKISALRRAQRFAGSTVGLEKVKTLFPELQ